MTGPALRRRDLIATLAVLAPVLFGRPSQAQALTMLSPAPWSHRGLHGTLVTGQDLPPGPAVLILAGSGPTDRDGNGPDLASNTYRLLARGLAAAGIRSLRYDKRGVGASKALVKNESDLVFPALVDDAAAAAQDLAARPEVSTVVLAGHSEGALVALQAAQRAATPAAGLVLLAAPGRPLAAVLRDQLAAAPLGARLHEQATAILDELVQGHRVEDVPPALRPIFRPAVQPYLMSMLTLDPAAMLAALVLPTLLIQGGRDIQIGTADFEALRRARPDARAVRLAHANHVLKRAPADRAGNVAVYDAPDRPLDPGVVPAVVAFVRGLSPPTGLRP